MGTQLVDPTYPGHPLCSIYSLWNLQKPLHILLNFAKYCHLNERSIGVTQRIQFRVFHSTNDIEKLVLNFNQLY